MKEWLINKLLGFVPYSSDTPNNTDKRMWPKIEYVGNESGALAKAKELDDKGIENHILQVGEEWIVATKGGK